MKPYGIIYILINKINFKCYIGQTKQRLNKRLDVHKTNSKKRPGKSPHFYNAIRKYGWDNFYKLKIDKAYDRQELDELEAFYIRLFNSVDKGYNLKYGGASSPASEETRNKISKAAIERFKIKENHPMFNKRHAESSNNKNRDSNKSKRAIGCHQIDRIFQSAKEAAIFLNISQGNISRYLRDPLKNGPVCGYTFFFI